jgi:hypothetical protein
VCYIGISELSDVSKCISLDLSWQDSNSEYDELYMRSGGTVYMRNHIDISIKIE